MADLSLVAGKFKEQCEMLRLYILVFNDDAVCILSLMHDVRKKALRNQRQLKVAGIAVVV